MITLLRVYRLVYSLQSGIISSRSYSYWMIIAAMCRSVALSCPNSIGRGAVPVERTASYLFLSSALIPLLAVSRDECGLTPALSRYPKRHSWCLDLTIECLTLEPLYGPSLVILRNKHSALLTVHRVDIPFVPL